MPHHYRPIIGEESLICEDADHCPPPRKGGWVAHRASGSRVLHREAGGCSPGKTSWVEVMNELIAKHWGLEELCL
jgi:hypothetical protein